MTDNEEIRALVHRYADAVCRRDEAQWAATWAKDASWSLGGSEISGRTAIVAFWTKAMGRLERVVQNALNGEAAVTGATGKGRWYVIEHYQRSDGVRGILLAAYDDRYVRTADGWRFQSRILDVFYNGAPDLSAGFLTGG